MAGRKDSIYRALLLVKLFMHGRKLTMKQIAQELEISVTSARRWVDVASLLFPITSENKQQDGRGRPPTVFFLILKN